MKTLQKLLPLFLTLSLLATWSCRTDPPVTEEPTEDISGITFKHTDNTVHIRLAAEPNRLSPFLTTSAYARPIYEQIFMPLLEYDPETLQLVPALAKSRPQTQEITSGPFAGGLAYTFELFEDATFSDGKPVTAEDVVFSFKLLFNYNIQETTPHRPGYASLADITIDPANKRKFTVFTKEKHIHGEDTYAGINVYPRHIFDPNNLLAGFAIADLVARGEELAADPKLQQHAEAFLSAPFSRDKSKVIGTGPYLLSQWEDGQYITMVRDQDWWADKNPKAHPHLVARPDSLVFRIIVDQTTAINALKDELVDVALQIDAQAFDEIKANDFVKSHYNFYNPSTFVLSFIAINNKDIRLSDKRVRRALAHLMDVELLIQNANAGYGEPITSPVLPSKPYHDKSLPVIPYDLEKAKSLLAEAGWKDSNANGTVDKTINGELVEMDLEYLATPGSRLAGTVAEILKDNAAQVGINIRITPREFRAMLGEEVARREYQLYAGAAATYPLPDDFSPLWHTASNTTAGQNRTQFGNAQSDALIEKINGTLNETERNKLYKQFQRIVYDEQPMVFLMSPQERMVVSKRFKGQISVLAPNFVLRNFVHLQK